MENWNRKTDLYLGYSIRNQEEYLLENWVIYHIKPVYEEIFGSVNKLEIERAINNRRFEIVDEKEFLKVFYEEIKKIYEEWRKDNDLYNTISFKSFISFQFEKKGRLQEFLFMECYYKMFSKKIVKPLQFISWKEKYFKFYWPSKTEFVKKPVFGKENNEKFLNFYNLPEWVVMLWNQVLSLRNKDPELEKEIRKFDKYMIWKYGKKITNREIRRELKVDLNNDDLENLELPRIRKDSWIFD